MARRVYYVSYENCTDFEPRPGWYVGTDSSRDIEGDEIAGPFGSRERALEIAAELTAA